MQNFIGHITVKLDSKGRFTFPAAFKKQLEPDFDNEFIVKKDIYETCLILYTKQSWQQIVTQLQKKLNPYNRQHNMFLRKFFMETAQLSLDNNNRLLLPKQFLDLAQIDKEILLIGAGNKIELWNPQVFDQNIISDEQFTQIAQTILGTENLDND